MNPFALWSLLLFKITTSLGSGDSFNMTIKIKPSPQQGFSKENTTVTLHGESNNPWTFAELWRNESLLCRSKGMQDEECSTDVNYAVSALNNIQIVPSENSRIVEFRLPWIQQNDTGTWRISMTRVLDIEHIEEADKELTMLVSRMAATRLGLVTGGQMVGEDTVQVVLGDSLSLVCSASGGRPEPWDMEWTLTPEWWGNVTTSNLTYGDNDPLCPAEQNCRSVNQTLSLVATHKGSQNISCTPKQALYFPDKRTMTIKVVTSDDSGGGGDTGSSPSLHKFDVVLIVLGCVGALILIAVIIAVAISKSGILKADEQDRRSDRVVDRSYIVGQDYHPRNHQRPANVYIIEDSSRTRTVSFDSDDLKATIFPGGRGGKVIDH